MNKSVVDRIKAVEESETEDFVKLSKIAKLKPDTSFRYKNLSNVNFSNCDLTGFDFTGSKLEGAVFYGANIQGAIFDAGQIEFLKNEGYFSRADSAGNETVLARFVEACSLGKAEEAARLLDGGADINGCNSSIRKTGLMAACYSNQVATVQMLLQRGAAIDYVSPFSQYSEDGATALMVAAASGNLKIVELLLEQGADVNIKQHANTALLLACKKDHPDVFSALLQASGISIQEHEASYVDPFLHACATGKSHFVELMADDVRIDVNFKYLDGATALHIACQNDHLNVVAKLLNRPEIDVNVKAGGHRESPLYVACHMRNDGVVKLLLSHSSIEVNSLTKESGTPLWIATNNNRFAVVNPRWRVAGTKETEQDTLDEGLGAQCVSHLLSHPSIDVNVRSENRWSTALMVAAATGQIDIVEGLAAHPRIDINLKNSEGETALAFARQDGHKEVEAYLMTIGAVV